uniref:Saposin B-type domain-containing protein n=1 Tax=Picea sitchensis TaxID=3332 RepID=A9P0S8_PICSI|nr:unknown [Picea sitchensis]
MLLVISVLCFSVLCFSAAPFALHFPSCRRLSDLLEKIQNWLEETAMYSRRAYPQIQVACRRILIRCGLYRPQI